MARKKHPHLRQALLLAFAAGTLTGAAGAMALRRRPQDGDGWAGAGGRLDENSFPPFNGRMDGPAQAVRAAVGQQS
ncbi:hypothetical protein [Micromonospora sp. HK10]|uniref:hypothetical protein n=1 Tax=Micromonospora sp. HK10 TaxID=1538294 RepID=UPI00062700F2|nr:hypothetical protein [Micromonospora sp. HK10]KKJ93730.1 hypothetical protein LQ51_29555 [Micromonospora sp. HK10]